MRCLSVLTTLTFFSLLASCAQRIKVPINHMISPEAIGRGVGVEYRKVGFSTGLLDFSNAKTNNALDMTTVTEDEIYIGLGLSPEVDLFYKVAEESTSLLGMKLQVLGTPSKARAVGHKLSLSFAAGANTDNFSGVFDIEIKSVATEYSLIYGYRFGPSVLVYQGLTYGRYEFSGVLDNPGPAFSTNEFNYRADAIWSANTGVVVGAPDLYLKLEYGAQRIKWSHTDASLHHSVAYALGAGF